MSGRPSILCPIDFSEASAGALRYAAAIADHFAARLIVFSVEEPLLTGAADLGTGCGGRPRRARTTSGSLRRRPSEANRRRWRRSSTSAIEVERTPTEPSVNNEKAPEVPMAVELPGR